MGRDITLEDTIYIKFTTRAFATGIPGTLGGTPVLSVLEDNNATPITAGVSVSVDRGSVTGLNEATIVATVANGYEAGKGYGLYISTGTVDSVSVVGEVVGEFTIGASAAAVDLANATDGLGALKTLIDAIPTTAMRGTDNVVLAGPTKAEMDTAHSLLATEAKQDIIDGNVDDIEADLDNGTDGLSALKALIDAIQTVVDAIPTTAMRGTDNVVLAGPTKAELDTAETNITRALQPQKNAALSNLEFLMVDSVDHVTPKTGLTVTGQRSIDGGAESSVSGTIAEVASGIYQFDALAADTNGDIITYRFSSSGADDTFVTIKTTA